MKKFIVVVAGIFIGLTLYAGHGFGDDRKHHKRGRFEVVEATIPGIQAAIRANKLSSEKLVKLYLERIAAYEETGPSLNAFLHINPNALAEARRADALRRRHRGDDDSDDDSSDDDSSDDDSSDDDGKRFGPLFGIPILLKDIIDTADMPTTAGSVSLEGSFPPDDAFLTQQLRKAGAIILGKATLTEFANFLTVGMPAGYSSLGRYGFNPYDPRPLPGGDGRPVLSPGGSSSASGIAVAANLVTVAIGTETSGSILSPAYRNMVVGIKPTLGLISRDGITPITADQDTAGPFGRTVTDAAIVLGTLTAQDPNDPATMVPGRVAHTDYTQFLDKNALKGAVIGVPRLTYWVRTDGTSRLSPDQIALMEQAIQILRDEGATVIDPAEILSAVELSTYGICVFLDQQDCSTVLKFGFKRDLDNYLASRGAGAPVHSLADVIAFNNAFPDPQIALKYGQVIAEASVVLDVTPGSADDMRYQADRAKDLLLSRDLGIDEVMERMGLDALIFPRNIGSNIAARAGYPSVMVPVGLLSPVDPVEQPTPYGMMFTARAWEEPKIIALAYAFEQASKFRRPPASTPPLPKKKRRR